jgi:phage-related holin
MAVIFYFVSNEGISVLENAAFLGVPFPEKLRDMLLGLNDKAKPEGDEAGKPEDGDAS